MEVSYEEAIPFPPFPTYKWFLSVYIMDVWLRRSTLLAELTSSHGKILKIDSTRKVTKKLQGAAANTAMWMTNVGNERGEVLRSVLTASESTASLQHLANGLMSRYEMLCREPPTVIYSDRDCVTSADHRSFSPFSLNGASRSVLTSGTS